jgi:ADP-ribose pyrophosphatase
VENRHVPFVGRIITVAREPFTLADGRRITMEVVRHRGSVVLLPQPSAGEIILIRQFRPVIGRWLWELPAGSLEPGEAPRRAAARECHEEVGLRPRRLERLGAFYPTPGFCTERMVFFRCLDLVRPRTVAALDPDEQLEPRTFTLDDVWRRIREREIMDMKTIVGLTLLASPGPSR